MRTNEQIMMQLMQFSRHGAMMQAFIMQGLEQYAQSVLQHTEPPEGWPELINWESWHGCAEEVVTELNKHFTRGTSDARLHSTN
jgi:hypothetical protein